MRLIETGMGLPKTGVSLYGVINTPYLSVNTYKLVTLYVNLLRKCSSVERSCK